MTDLSRSNSRDGDFYRSLGALEERVDGHEQKLDQINDKLDTLLATTNKIKGGWWVLSILISAAVTFGSLAHEILAALKRFFGS